MKSAVNGTKSWESDISSQQQNTNSKSSYPLPAYLNFVPGGIEYVSGNSTQRDINSTADAKDTYYYNLNSTSPDILIKRAYAADSTLRKFAMRYAVAAAENSMNDSSRESIATSVPYRLPSLSILAEAVFGTLTGVQASSVRQWADAMVLHYSDDGDDDKCIDSVSESIESILALDDSQLIEQYEQIIEDIPSTSKPASTATANTSSSSGLVKMLKSLRMKQESEANISPSASSDILHNTEDLHDKSATSSLSLPVRPCGYVFRSGDIAWNCRTCQADSTCVLCDSCFRNSDHEGHEVFFHSTSPGGCCDCGDIEAWKFEGCCPKHRPRNVVDRSSVSNLQTAMSQDGESNCDDKDPKNIDNDIDYEAVRMSCRGRMDGDMYVKHMLPPRLAAALGVVIGAAVNALVKAVDGAGIGNDQVQWTRRWADQVRKLTDKCSNEEEYVLQKENVEPCAYSVGDAMGLPFPNRFRLHIRLHNDDVHTFDEVIQALYDHTKSRATPDSDSKWVNTGLVESKRDAEEMTNHVDTDGQVTIRTYTSFSDAKVGFQRLKSRGLHSSIVSTPQVDLELRSRILITWLTDISEAHPGVAALIVHALVDITGGTDALGKVFVWENPRMLPVWCHNSIFVTSSKLKTDGDIQNSMEIDSIPCWRKRMDVFLPHKDSSYLTREEMARLYVLGMNGNESFPHLLSPHDFGYIRCVDPKFYSKVPYLLPNERYKKSPHALWGTMPTSKTCTHPTLEVQRDSSDDSYHLIDRLLVIDTDFRKQQEAEILSTSIHPHNILGLYMISGVGLVNVIDDIDGGSERKPTAEEWRHILSLSSYRAPISPVLLLLLLDPYPTKQLRGAIHSLFLISFVDFRFKARFAANLGGVAYRSLSTLFCAGVGTDADTPLGFTVQIFTTGSLVRALCNTDATRKLLNLDDDTSCIGFQDVFTLPLAHNIVRCIHTNLLGATKEVLMVLKNTAAKNPFDDKAELNLHPTLTYQPGELPLSTLLPAAPDDEYLESRPLKHKRLPHLLRDLGYVFETPGTALRLLLQNDEVSDGNYTPRILPFSVTWSRLLRLAQGIDPQKRKISGGHVEYEQLRWLEAFSLSLNFTGPHNSLAESLTSLIQTSDRPSLQLIQQGVGNAITALLHEIKWWLYKEYILEALPTPTGNETSGKLDPIDALQRSTLHVPPASSGVASCLSEDGGMPSLALSCAFQIKMTENHLKIIENALKSEQSQHNLNASGRGPVMGDWLRVPHSPLMGDSFSFHLPLHRALARHIRSVCSIVIPSAYRETVNLYWWKIPVLDDCSQDLETFEHPLMLLIRKTLRSSNCRVTWLSGPECDSNEAQVRRSRSRTVSAAVASAKIIHSICDHPLRCLAAAEQISRHLWARNGSSAGGMALNYGTVPLCKHFRDLDLTMVQLSASGFSIGLGVKRVFSLLLSRFNLDGYLCDPEKRPVSRNGTGSSYPGSGWVNPLRLQDPDHAVALMEAFFSLICVLVSELPSPPPVSYDDDTHLRARIRRELLHALAAEPRTHSEAMVAASSAVTRGGENSDNGLDGVTSFRNIFSEILQEIGKSKIAASRASGATCFELKQEYSDEYDPTFFHLRRAEHQHAMDVVAILRKNKTSGTSGSPIKDRKTVAKCLPIVRAPPTAHPRFLSCRLMLHLPALDGALRRALLFALTNGEWFPPEKMPEETDMILDSDSFSSELSDSKSNNNNPIRKSGSNYRHYLRPINSTEKKKREFSSDVVQSSSVSFLEVLQLLTLQVHTLEDCASIHKCFSSLDIETKSISSDISVNTYLERLIFVPDSLRDSWALLPYPDGPLQSKGSGANKGSILGLLIALYEHRSDNGNNSKGHNNTSTSEDDLSGAKFLVADGLKWLLRFVDILVDGAPSVSKAIESASSGIPCKVSKADGSSWTIRADLQSSISEMLKNLPDLWPNQEGDISSSISFENNAKNNAKNHEARKVAQMRAIERMKKQQAAFAASITTEDLSDKKCDEEEKDLCIICRCDDDDGESNGPLGYLGHVQRSRSLQLRQEKERVCMGQSYVQAFRVVGLKGCMIRESEAMDSPSVACIPFGSIVTVPEPMFLPQYGLLGRRVFVRHQPPENGSVLEGWANIQTSHGYVILNPLLNMCYKNTRWGCTRPIIRQCGHAAHLGCVETHVISIHQKALQSDAAYDGRYAADIEDGEFLCPLCKQLCNVVVPIENDEYCTEKETQIPSDDTTDVMNSADDMDSIRSALHRSPMKIIDEGKEKAVKQYGIYLFQAMQVLSWHSRNSRLQSKKNWHTIMNNWDYEEEQRDTYYLPSGKVPIGNILRLLRQQHIAWAAIGHSAASSEASARGLRKRGFDPPTSDPWVDFNSTSLDSHPMLLELRRTLSAASSLYSLLHKALCEKVIGAENGGDHLDDTPITGFLLSRILEGYCWTDASLKNCFSSQWSVLTALLSALPCHVSSDETLSARQEARATAAAIWAVKGFVPSSVSTDASDDSNKDVLKDPPFPFSVRQVPSFADILSKPWGTLSPHDVVNVDAMIPFRPALATAFLYVPLLAWDLNTLAGALFSSLLSCPSTSLQSLCATARVLLVGRLVQSITTPNSLNRDFKSAGEILQETQFDKVQENEALRSLIKHCRSITNPSSDIDDLSEEHLLSAVSYAILPFARTLVLILRAATSILRQHLKIREFRDNMNPEILDLIENEDTMYIEDGFFFLEKMGAPCPSEIMKGSPWLDVINRWLSAACTFETYHGSSGRYVAFDESLQQWVSSKNEKIDIKLNRTVGETSNRVQQPPQLSDVVLHRNDEMMECALNEDVSSDHEEEEEEIDDNSSDSDELHDPPATFFATHDDSDDEEMVQLDEENVFDERNFDIIQSTLPVQQDDSDDDESSTASAFSWDIDHSHVSSSIDTMYANVSSAVIIPYQPSLLGKLKPGPGPRGKWFDNASASGFMSDLSHLGISHKAGGQGSGLIRLPRSFVELYGIVNEVKKSIKNQQVDDEGINSHSETAICLITGTIMNTGSVRRQYHRDTKHHREPGECTLHARRVGSGTGVFFLVKKCTVLLIHNKKSAYSASLYLDENGEEDTSLRRGRPLFLKEERYEALENLWRQHGIPREVAQIRSTSDRVIRDNWY